MAVACGHACDAVRNGTGGEDARCGGVGEREKGDCDALFHGRSLVDMAEADGV